eukprot:gnl/TRDRNA2_/TRDRNA2_85162_c1_seq1.p1 gnl/TRDRNA2_/TRDRNA2_85162_c1~~gnl/TRDRNA2_/TRDRNA2_85162_c1_seq1.p1  ORF type:complete len:120 (-),score=20.99 gnl/TRDRNA2_/TRDRNA2_85162_c1_seq1:51-410(-)
MVKIQPATSTIASKTPSMTKVLEIGKRYSFTHTTPELRQKEWHGQVLRGETLSAAFSRLRTGIIGSFNPCSCLQGLRNTLRPLKTSKTKINTKSRPGTMYSMGSEGKHANASDEFVRWM